MKITLLYSALITLGCALWTLGLFFLGYHSDATKLASLGQFGTVVPLAVFIGGIILGTRARRDEIPLGEEFSYGQALGTGVMIGVFAALFSAIFNLIYVKLINPELAEVMIQIKNNAIQAKGLNSQQIEAAQKFFTFITNPVVQFVGGIIIFSFFSFLVAVISSSFLRKPAGALPGQKRPPTLPA